MNRKLGIIKKREQRNEQLAKAPPRACQGCGEERSNKKQNLDKNTFEFGWHGLLFYLRNKLHPVTVANFLVSFYACVFVNYFLSMVFWLILYLSCSEKF